MIENQRPKEDVAVELTDEEKKKLKEMVGTWDTASRAIKFINVIGHILKWVLGVGSAFGIIWSSFHGGSPR